MCIPKRMRQKQRRRTTTTATKKEQEKNRVKNCFEKRATIIIHAHLRVLSGSQVEGDSGEREREGESVGERGRGTVQQLR